MSIDEAAAGSPRILRAAQGVKTVTRLFPSAREAMQHVVRLIDSLIREKQAAGQKCVLGLPTGSTPVGVYRELIHLHQQEKLDFSHVVTFNLDEYYRLAPEELQSYHRFMRENFFDHVNVQPKNIHIPDGTVPIERVEEYCDDYEHEIRRAGGIDLLLLGIGRTGHIGFNEPGSSRHSQTRLVRLDPVTRRDAADAFFGEENVPTQAITMGMQTIMQARKIVLMAIGEHKATVVRIALEGPVTETCPASILQEHRDAVYIVDPPAASELTGMKTPWQVRRCEWTSTTIRKALLWLAFQSGKALLKLTAEDFREHNLHELLREHGPAHALCRKVFDEMMATLCDDPAAVLTTTTGEELPKPAEPRKVLCFSPHPDDDVISMGGTLLRLRERGHEVHVAYMTSGNVAVFDHDALRFANFAADFNQLFGIEREKSALLEQTVYDFLAKKAPAQIDSMEVLAIKALIRKTEAIAAASFVNIPESCLHFLDLPFYRTGRTAKNRLSEDDLSLVANLLEQLQPDQIYIAGDLADPHGTHRICAEAAFEAVTRYRAVGHELEVWLYRGAWQEWEPHQIERAVPLSPEDLDRKRSAIFRHESQKDRAMFPGHTDQREFWQRAEDRNRGTAALYDKLGLPEYYAIEGFVRWKGKQA